LRKAGEGKEVENWCIRRHSKRLQVQRGIY